MHRLFISKTLYVFLFSFIFISTAHSQQIIDVSVEGISDGKRDSKQKDRDEAIMDAKLRAIEKAGVKIKSFTEVEDFQLKKDWISSQAEAYLLPNFNIIETGYGEDNLYHVVLTGKVKLDKKPSDLDDILASLDDLKTDKSATIDDLISESDNRAVDQNTSSRRGDITTDLPTDISGTAKNNVGRTANAIHQVILSHIKAIRYCYDRELKRDPSLKGKIEVGVTVTPLGSVKRAEIISSTLNNTRVERCIISRIELWKDFPSIEANEGDVVFRQIFTVGY